MLWQAIQLGHLGMSIPVACILHVSQHIDNTDYARYWQDERNRSAAVFALLVQTDFYIKSQYPFKLSF